MKRSHKEDSRLYDLRCTICCAVLVLIAAIRPLHAQDILPGSLSCHAGGADCDTLCLYSQRTDTVSVPLITFPAAFRQMKENVLTDSLGILNPFWEKLRLSRLGASADTLRIVHVGDSHIRGHIFPRTTGALMQDTFGAVSYTDVGINGAFALLSPVRTVLLILRLCIPTCLFFPSGRTKAITAVTIQCCTIARWTTLYACFARNCRMYRC